MKNLKLTENPSYDIGYIHEFFQNFTMFGNMKIFTKYKFTRHIENVKKLELTIT